MSGTPAPRPDNFDAMAAAWNDPVELARQRAIYNAQLIEAGLPPLYEIIDYTEPQREDRHEGIRA